MGDRPTPICTRKAEENGWDHVADGTARTIYSVPKESPTGESCVLKVAQHHGGVIQNQTEAETWNEVGPARTHLAPIRDHDDGHRWVLMQEVTGDVTVEEVREWQREMEQDGWMCRDIKNKNFGQGPRGVKMIDYGEGCRPW